MLLPAVEVLAAQLRERHLGMVSAVRRWAAEAAAGQSQPAGGAPGVPRLPRP